MFSSLLVCLCLFVCVVEFVFKITQEVVDRILITLSGSMDSGSI